MKRKRSYPSFPDRSIAITTSGKKITWKPREAIEGPYRIQPPTGENKTQKARRKVRRVVRGRVFPKPTRGMRWWAKDKASEELGEQGERKNSVDTIIVPPLLLDEARPKKGIFKRLKNLLGSRLKSKSGRIKEEQEDRTSVQDNTSFAPSLVAISPRQTSPRGRRARHCPCCGARSPLARNPATYSTPRITSQEGLGPLKKGARPVVVYLPRGPKALLSDSSSAKEARVHVCCRKEKEVGESKKEGNSELVNVNSGMAGQESVNLTCRGGSGGSSQGSKLFSIPSNPSSSLPKTSRLQRRKCKNRRNHNSSPKSKSRSWPSFKKIVGKCLSSQQSRNSGRAKNRRIEFVQTNSISQESLVEIRVEGPLYLPRPPTPHSNNPKKYFITGEGTPSAAENAIKMKFSNADQFCLFATGCRGLTPKDIKTPDLNLSSTLKKCLEDLDFDLDRFSDSGNALELEQAQRERTEEDIRMLAPCVDPSSDLEFVSRMRYLPAALQEAIKSSLPSPQGIQKNAVGEEDFGVEGSGDSMPKKRPTLALTIPKHNSRFWRRRLSSWEFVDDTDAAGQFVEEIIPTESSQVNNAVTGQLAEQFETTLPSPSSAQLSYMSRAVYGSFTPPHTPSPSEEFATIARNWKAENFSEAESPADADDILHPSPCYFLDGISESSGSLKSKLKAKGASMLKPFRRTKKQQPPPVTTRQAQILAEACMPRARSCSSLSSAPSTNSTEFVLIRGRETISLF